jgi:Outer membrane protein beta-barrel domain
MLRLRVLCSLTLLLTAAGTAAAQGSEPIGLFAADVRVTFPKYKQTESVATALGVDTLDLPTRGLGLVFGAHVYPLRKGVVTLGLGAELMASRRNRTQETAAGTVAQTVQTRFSSFSPQISLNFGAKQGWSYISGGLGWGRFTTELESAPLPDADGRVKTINYGGGARWFVNDHVAVSLDLRFYAVNPQEASLGRPAFPRMTILAFSAGLALK